MDLHERSLVNYLFLAQKSSEKQQYSSRDRFLLLGGIAACKAGYLKIAEQCYQIVIAQEPKHLIGRYRTIADALRDPDFIPFEKSLIKFCSHERAELYAIDYQFSAENQLKKHSDSMELLSESLLGDLKTSRQ